MQFKVAVKGIIRKGSKILILKRSLRDDHQPGVWETVGGGMDKKTTPGDNLEREIKEETNLKVKIGEPFNVFTFKTDMGEFKFGITFLCDYIKGKIKLSSEHIDYQWINPQEFNQFKSVPSLKKEIKRYAKKYAKD